MTSAWWVVLLGLGLLGVEGVGVWLLSHIHNDNDIDW
jgi:hypothetical protein